MDTIRAGRAHLTERERAIEARLNAAQCSYVGKCNSTRCPEHGGQTAETFALLDALSLSRGMLAEVVATRIGVALLFIGAEVLRRRNEVLAAEVAAAAVFYRITVEQRNAAWAEVEALKLEARDAAEATRVLTRELADAREARALAEEKLEQATRVTSLREGLVARTLKAARALADYQTGTQARARAYLDGLTGRGPQVPLLSIPDGNPTKLREELASSLGALDDFDRRTS